MKDLLELLSFAAPILFEYFLMFVVFLVFFLIGSRLLRALVREGYMRPLMAKILLWLYIAFVLTFLLVDSIQTMKYGH